MVQLTAGGAVIANGMVYTHAGVENFSAMEAAGFHPDILPGTYQIKSSVLSSYASNVGTTSASQAIKKLSSPGQPNYRNHPSECRPIRKQPEQLWQ
jgi:hypothetical protein